MALNEENPKRVKRQLVFKKESNQKEHILTLCKNENILIGDWCIFKYGKHRVNKLVLGNIIGFKYIKGRTAKEKKYSWETVPIKSQAKLKTPRSIEALATWFVIGSNIEFRSVEEQHSSFINIDRYVAILNCSCIKLIPESGSLVVTSDTMVLNTLNEQLA